MLGDETKRDADEQYVSNDAVGEWSDGEVGLRVEV
jgi:hypothetical protein